MIRVICADISGLRPGDYERLYQLACPERKARADRYRRREDALRCVAADALLRKALGSGGYTVERTPSGKPFIKENKNFHFNLSHAGNWVVIAYGDREVGVDVEAHRENIDMETIAGRFFSPEEQRYIFSDKENPRQRFFEIWTGKESCLKYLGVGLKTDLTSFSVLSLKPELRLHHRSLPGGYSLCLCTTESDYSLELLDSQRLL